MKKILYGCFLLLVMACSKKQDSIVPVTPTPKPSIDLTNIGDSAYFYGSWIGKSHFFKERPIKGQYFLSHGLGFYSSANKDTSWVYITNFGKYAGNPAVGFEDIEAMKSELHRPMGIQNVQTFKDFFIVGQKRLAQKQGLEEEVGFGFCINYKNSTSGELYYTSYGDQTGSSLDILEKKDILDENGHSVVVKFKIKCKLYGYDQATTTKKYVGDLDGIHQTRFLYKPFRF